jgi:hypothetical protein
MIRDEKHVSEEAPAIRWAARRLAAGVELADVAWGLDKRVAPMPGCQCVWPTGPSLDSDEPADPGRTLVGSDCCRTPGHNQRHGQLAQSVSRPGRERRLLLRAHSFA